MAPAELSDNLMEGSGVELLFLLAHRSARMLIGGSGCLARIVCCLEETVTAVWLKANMAASKPTSEQEVTGDGSGPFTQSETWVECWALGIGLSHFFLLMSTGQ